MSSERNGMRNKFPYPLLFPLLLIFVLLILLFQKKILFPATEIITSAYSDKQNGGHSFIEVLSDSEEGIRWTYTLSPGYAYPHAGISFQPSEPVNRWSYNRLTLRMETEGSEEVKLLLESEIPGSSHVLYQGDILLKSSSLVHHLNLDELFVPFWWYLENASVLKSKDIPRRISKIGRIKIENAELSSDTQNAILGVAEIYLSRKPLPIILGGALLICIYILVLLFFKLRKSQKHYAVRSISDLSTLSEDFPDPKFRRLIEYLSIHYRDKEISVVKVCDDLNCSASWIYRKLMANLGISFNAYVSILRINEARRILEYSSISISELSEELGFSSRKSFSRQFLAIAGERPLSFRKKKKTSR